MNSTADSKEISDCDISYLLIWPLTLHILILAILGIVTADVPTCSADISLSHNLGQNWAIHTDFTARERQLSFTALCYWSANGNVPALLYVSEVLTALDCFMQEVC